MAFYRNSMNGKLIALHREGKSREQMAQILGISKYDVTRKLCRLKNRLGTLPTPIDPFIILSPPQPEVRRPVNVITPMTPVPIAQPTPTDPFIILSPPQPEVRRPVNVITPMTPVPIAQPTPTPSVVTPSPAYIIPQSLTIKTKRRLSDDGEKIIVSISISPEFRDLLKRFTTNETIIDANINNRYKVKSKVTTSNSYFHSLYFVMFNKQLIDNCQTEIETNSLSSYDFLYNFSDQFKNWIKTMCKLADEQEHITTITINTQRATTQ